MNVNQDYRKLFSSPELERHCLSGYLKYPNVFVDIDLFCRETDFTFKSHRIIYSVARNLRIANQSFDPIILGQKIKELGVSFKDDIDIFSYIDILYADQISEPATVSSFKELEKQRILKELCEQSDKVKEFVISSRDKEIDKVITGVDAIYSDKLSLHVLKDEPKDIYSGLKELVIKTGENPVDTPGLITGFPTFDAMFGGIYACNGLYCVVSRPKTGKTTFLLNLAKNVTTLNKDVVCLFLDTELTTKLEQYRLLSGISGVKSYFLETACRKAYFKCFSSRGINLPYPLCWKTIRRNLKYYS